MVASGANSTVIGGGNNRASGDFSVAAGIFAVADADGQLALGGGIHANPGDSQHSTYVVRNSTADGATTTRLSFDADPTKYLTDC